MSRNSIDGITVAVDNEDYGTVYYPENGLSTIANQNNNFNLGTKWNTREAPFDKEVSRTLGLHHLVTVKRKLNGLLFCFSFILLLDWVLVD